MFEQTGLLTYKRILKAFSDSKRFINCICPPCCPCSPLWLVCASYRSYPGLFSLASSHIWRWWLGSCYMRRGMPHCCGAASPSRPAPLSVPSPCSPWSTCITCLPELRIVWITAVSKSEICNVFFILFFFFFLQLSFSPNGKWLLKPVFRSWVKHYLS